MAFVSSFQWKSFGLDGVYVAPVARSSDRVPLRFEDHPVGRNLRSVSFCSVENLRQGHGDSSRATRTERDQSKKAWMVNELVRGIMVRS